MPQPQGLQPGVYFIDMETYHADPAIGSSGIKDLLISPRRYWFNSPLNPKRKPKKETPALRFGKAFHAMILEPENFEKYIAIMPKKFIPAKQHPTGLSMEKQKELFIEANSDKIIVSHEEIDTMIEMLYALQVEPAHLNALKSGLSEVSIFWRDAETGLMCKIRADRFAPLWVSDLKTTTSIDDKNLRHEFPKRGYDVSGAMYSEGMIQLKEMIRGGYKMPSDFSDMFMNEFMSTEKQHFAFIFQEKESPYITRLWRMTPYITEIGYDKFRKGLSIYQDHQNKIDAWPSGFPVVEDIDESMLSQSVNF